MDRRIINKIKENGKYKILKNKIITIEKMAKTNNGFCVKKLFFLSFLGSLCS